MKKILLFLVLMMMVASCARKPINQSTLWVVEPIKVKKVSNIGELTVVQNMLVISGDSITVDMIVFDYDNTVRVFIEEDKVVTQVMDEINPPHCYTDLFIAHTPHNQLIARMGEAQLINCLTRTGLMVYTFYNTVYFRDVCMNTILFMHEEHKRLRTHWGY